MISYELAKKLKDSGFPQKQFIAHHNGDRIMYYYDSIYIPTLPELTDECFQLNKGLSFDCQLKENRFYVVFNTQDEHGNYLDYWCPSLEEVFAMEWLELINKCEACKNKNGLMHTCDKFR